MNNYKPHPMRIQRMRTKGWRMPSGAVYVGRPTKWGNPFRETHMAVFDRYAMLEIVYGNLDLSELRGKSLACWCPLDRPCHADTWLWLVEDEWFYETNQRAVQERMRARREEQ